MTRLWFRAKRYGWGWTPASVEGWLVMAAFMVAVVIGGGVLFYRVRHGVGARQALVSRSTRCSAGWCLRCLLFAGRRENRRAGGGEISVRGKAWCTLVSLRRASGRCLL